MRYTPSQDPARDADPAARHSFGYSLVASALVAVATVALVVALSYPVAATGAVALGTTGWLAVRTLRQSRRRAGRTRQVCVPETEVCVEV